MAKQNRKCPLKNSYTAETGKAGKDTCRKLDHWITSLKKKKKTVFHFKTPRFFLKKKEKLACIS